MRLLLTILLAASITPAVAQSGFASQQLTYARVEKAYSEKYKTIAAKLKAQRLDADKLHILLVAYKAEQELVLYARNATDKQYTPLETFRVCARSGSLGPKRASGDYQVPEGFYYIDRFNPESSYHLSLGINYPNLSDRRKSKAKNLGGDIFIHGDCLTIGCLPMTDDKMKEIYVYAVQARKSGQEKIPVYIFPFKMHGPNMQKYKAAYRKYPELLSFWDNLKTGYDSFKVNKTALAVRVMPNGDYTF